MSLKSVVTAMLLYIRLSSAGLDASLLPAAFTMPASAGAAKLVPPTINHPLPAPCYGVLKNPSTGYRIRIERYVGNSTRVSNDGLNPILIGRARLKGAQTSASKIPGTFSQEVSVRGIAGSGGTARGHHVRRGGRILTSRLIAGRKDINHSRSRKLGVEGSLPGELIAAPAIGDFPASGQLLRLARDRLGG